MPELILAERITSLQNPRIKAAIRLHSSRGRKQQDRMIVFGQREISRAIVAGVNVESIFLMESDADDLLNDLGSDQVAATSKQITFVTDEIMQKLSYGDRVDGCVAVAHRPPTSLEQIDLSKISRPLFVVLEAVEKPGNIGAVIRSIDATGASGLILANPITDVFHPNAIRSSTGVLFGMPIATGTNEDVQRWLAQHDFFVCTTFPESASSLFDCSLGVSPLAVVLGNEAVGVSEDWHQERFLRTQLPMLGQADSLNVSVTAAVILYEALRQRR
ncbi:MAG: TrmH family RNA methyltransferase [Planctomycetota bacterium]